MGKKMSFMTAVLVVVLVGCWLPAAKADSDSTGDWKLGMQAYSFNRFTFYEAIEKTKTLGMHFIEAYPGQQLSKEKPDWKFDHNMSSEAKQQALQKLREAGVRLVNYGVVGLSNNEDECRKVFNFAREMGIETIVSEPPEDAFDLVDRLCKEYKIKVAIHNHPKPSPYWDPDTVLKVCQGRSELIGSCADTGHWMRSGINPVEAVKKLKGRIVSLHFKDLNEFGRGDAHDVIWGQGKADARAILAELKKQDFKGVFSIEYEHNWLNSMPEIAGCVSYIDRTGAELGATDWQWVFNDKDLTGWDGDPRLWSVKDGAIRGETTLTNPAKGNTFLIWRGGMLKDFELKIKFRIQNGNSGIQYRSKDVGNWVVSGYQAEVENSPGKVGFLYHERGRGSLARVGEFVRIDEQGQNQVVGNVAEVNDLIKAGYYAEKEWNEYHIIGSGNHIVHYLNGYQTIELIDNDPKGSAREGILALQIHAGPPMVVEFKDIRVRHLKPKYGDAVLLFNGNDLSEWQFKGGKDKGKWVVGKARLSPSDPKLLVAEKGVGEMINLTTKHGESVDIFSNAKSGDCRIELQVMVPQFSNSGVYVMGEYEIQVLDSWDGVKMGSGDMGAIYGASPPPINACKRPGEWQKYVIDIQAPKFDGSGKKTENTRFIKVELNGQVIHENLEMKGPTPSGVMGKEAAVGPLMFQGDHGPVAYRNIVVKPLLQ